MHIRGHINMEEGEIWVYASLRQSTEVWAAPNDLEVCYRTEEGRTRENCVTWDQLIMTGLCGRVPQMTSHADGCVRA